MNTARYYIIFSFMIIFVRAAYFKQVIRKRKTCIYRQIAFMIEHNKYMIFVFKIN